MIQVNIIPEGIEIRPQVRTNGSHTITLKSNGTVWSYGQNSNGELGNETNSYSDDPVQAKFPEGVTITQIDCGDNFSAALDSQGNIWTWGSNSHGQLGRSVANSNIPTKVEGISKVTKIACGSYHVLAITESKEVYGFGQNANGELGIVSFTNIITTPTKAKYLSNVIDIACRQKP